MLKKLCIRLMICLVLGLVVVPAVLQAEQHTGRGVIVEANPASAGGISSLNPLRCSDDTCGRIVDWLFPMLFASDPKTGVVVNAEGDNQGLVVQPQLQDGNVQTFKLRDDALWSDGEPITAYDVFYSYLAITSPVVQSSYRPRILSQMVGMKVIDAHTIAVTYFAADCASFVRSNFPIAPAHVFDPDFARFVDEMNAQTSDEQPTKAWLEAYPEAKFEAMFAGDFQFSPTATAGRFDFEALRLGQDVRLTADDGKQAFVYTDLPGGMNPVEFFLAGKSSVLVNPPYERRDDLRATPDLQIAEYPGRNWDYIGFNLADPLKPQSLVDKDGKALDQGHHPIFSDVRVRRALQMAIDVPTLIETAFAGNGVPIAANQPPASWAYNPAIKPVGYDPMAAARVLESAGWKDTNGDGLRECHGCLNAKEDTPLSFTLLVLNIDQRGVVAELISRQLGMIGVSVNTQPIDLSSLLAITRSQQYDAYLGVRVFSEFSDPDQTPLFTRSSDVLKDGDNTGSYYNDQVDALMQQARTVPGCDMPKRAELYGQIQTILHDEQPYAWLYSTTDMVVAQGGVQGFQPYPNNPFWNVREWVVVQ